MEDLGTSLGSITVLVDLVSVMPSARPALSPAGRTSGDRDRLRSSIYLVQVRRHRQARRYTLRINAAKREVILTIPPRGSLKEAAICAKARRLDRGAPGAAAGSGAVCRWRGCSVARRTAPDRASPRTARHGVDRDAADGEPLLCVAGEAPHIARRISDFLRREARRELEIASLRFAATLGVEHQARRGARSIEPLGLVLDDRRAVVFLAAYPRAEPPCSNISPRTKWRIWSR